MDVGEIIRQFNKQFLNHTQLYHRVYHVIFPQIQSGTFLQCHTTGANIFTLWRTRPSYSATSRTGGSKI